MDAELPTLHGECVVLRPAEPADVERIAEILAEPGVARWWGRYDAGRVRAELDASFVIVAEGGAAGWLQTHEETDPDFPSVAFDIGLTTSVIGRGYGREALSLAVRHFISQGHHRFTIDPSADNERAIRSYRAVGFKPVGVLRAYWRDLDGNWRDGLLMDLLASDLDG